MENPVKKILLVATGQEGEVHLDKIPDFDQAGEEGRNRQSRRMANQSGVGCVAGVKGSEHDWAMYAKITATECCLIELQNTQHQHYHSINQRL
eukprot:4240649-Ditylum_brightwellii.AAC.1